MTDFNKVFLDTAPVIYFLDEDMNFGVKSRSIIEEILLQGKTIAASAITCMEYLVYPYRTNNSEKIEAFSDFIEEVGIPILTIGALTAAKAAQIRARYPAFKAMDALQLATAVLAGCDVFLTNDNQLRQFDELHCITVEDWELG